MRISSLNPTGLLAMSEWLDNRAAEEAVPEDLLRSGHLLNVLDSRLEVQQRTHGSRLQFAAYIDDAVMRPSGDAYARDAGFWAWLTLLYFDEVCPRVAGIRKVGASARYIPSFEEWKRYYRHLLAGPWMIYRAHRDQPQVALAVLAGPLAKPGDVVEQFAARMEWVTNPSVMETVTTLYFDRRAGQLKRGAGGKGRGSARRLASVLWQFDRTFDLYSVPCQQLIGMLPLEFEKYKPH